MKTAIITGANGFVGGALMCELLAQNVEVIALGREDCTGNLPKDARVHFVAHDLAHSTDLKDTLSTFHADIFYHFAWAGSAGAARADTELQLKNVQWTIDCLRLAKEVGCKRFVCAGSIMEHETMAAVYKQENRPGLGYIYGGAKLVAHTMCMSVATSIGIDLIWAEITNAYGVGELSPRFINTTLRKILHDEPLQFTSGTQNYDFVYITDVARAFHLIGEHGKPFYEYLIGSSAAKPLREFVLDMKQSLAPERDFIFGDVPFTGIDLPLSKFDCGITERDTGFHAEISFFDGIKKTMEWIRGQEGTK